MCWYYDFIVPFVLCHEKLYAASSRASRVRCQVHSVARLAGAEG